MVIWCRRRGEICPTGEIGLTKSAARSRDKEDANVMLIIILLVFFFASCELFCKRDRKFELTAGEQGICIMQLQ